MSTTQGAAKYRGPALTPKLLELVDETMDSILTDFEAYGVAIDESSVHRLRYQVRLAVMLASERATTHAASELVRQTERAARGR